MAGFHGRLICPRCQETLALEALTECAAETAWTCPRCAGHWLAASDLDRIENSPDLRFLERGDLPGPEAQMAPLRCPSCPARIVMLKNDSPVGRHVVIDQCPICGGVWLDRGELAAIRERGVLTGLVEAVRAFLWA